MVKAGKLYICDRCGDSKFVEDPGIGERTSSLGLGLNDRIFAVSPVISGWIFGEEKKPDLCPTCAGEYEKFMKKG